MKTQIISIDEFRRSFGEVKKQLPFKDYILTDRGNPIAVLKSTPKVKRELLKQTAGSLKGSALDNDEIWSEVAKRKSRKSAISL